MRFRKHFSGRKGTYTFTYFLFGTHPYTLILKRMDKEQVAEILAEIGTLLELKGENPFKTRAYANAARTIESLSEPLTKIVAENRLGEIKGVGEALTKKITEFVTTGKLKYYDELKASIHPV